VAVAFVKCPTCRQKLAIFDYMATGTLVVCANLACGTSLRINSRRPLRVEPVPEPETYKIDYRPESYG
jgi:hypothetical protein